MIKLLNLVVMVVLFGLVADSWAETRIERYNLDLTVPDLKTPKSRGSCRMRAAIQENFNWFHKDHPHHGVRNRILAALVEADADAIRDFYKRGQAHNASARDIIDYCDDEDVLEMAQEFAEGTVRVQRCGDPQPAPSANCGDLRENLRWALLENAECSRTARTIIFRAFRAVLNDERRVAAIRKAFKSAQWHRSDVHDSIDFLSDKIVLDTARSVVQAHSININSGKNGESDRCEPRSYRD